MNPETIIAELRGINAWRRGGEEIEQPDPKHIGEVLDAAADSLRSLIASNTTLRSGLGEARAEVAQLKGALALVQENCDAEYEALREERDEARAELARVTAERDGFKTSIGVMGDRMRLMDAELSALRQDKARMTGQLAMCADLLDEVRTGEDFECVCSDAADAARAAMKEVHHG